jgi:type IV secretion system protein VirB8
MNAKTESISPSKLEKQFFEEGQTWETDRLKDALNSRRTAWIVASAACVMAGLAIIAVIGLTPLKRVEPYVVRVDNATGGVDVVTALKDSKETYTEAVTKHFLLRYVLSRESYSRQAASSNYESVGLMSTAAVSKRYFELFKPDNPESPLNVYGKSATVELKVKSIAFMGPNIATVRYARLIYRATGETPEATQWVATVGFKYSASSMRERDRLLNPLGFQVSEYRVDPDSLEAK